MHGVEAQARVDGAAMQCAVEAWGPTWVRIMPTSAILAEPSRVSSTLGLFRSRCSSAGRLPSTHPSAGVNLPMEVMLAATFWWDDKAADAQCAMQS